MRLSYRGRAGALRQSGIQRDCPGSTLLTRNNKWKTYYLRAMQSPI
jgi:hypothetical protein